MTRIIRVIALALALAATPACASLSAPPNPIAAAETLDQRAYAVLHAYAAVIEEATDLVRDPATPPAFRRALGQAERVGTPAAETIGIATSAYVQARADFEAAAHAGQPALERAALALTIAARRLSQATEAARADR